MDDLTIEDIITKLNNVILRGKLNGTDRDILFKIYIENGKFIGKEIYTDKKYELNMNTFIDDGSIYFPYDIYENNGVIYTYEIMHDIPSITEVNEYLKKCQIINYVNDHIDWLLENDSSNEKKEFSSKKIILFK